MSLFWRIYAWVFITSLVVFALASYGISSKQISDLQHQIVDKHKALTSLLAKQMEVGVIEGHWPFEALHKLSNRSDVLFWWVVRPDGSIYLANEGKFIGTLAYDYFPHLRERNPSTHTYVDGKDNFGIAFEPLNIKGNRWSFWLGYTLDEVSDATRRIIVVAAILFVSVIGALGVMLFFIIRYFLRPIAGLAEGASVIGEGNFDHRVAVDTEDELGQLAVAFNSMAESLRRTTISRDQLEQRVEARTEELRKANEELKHAIEVRSLAEEELRKSQEKYRSLVETAQEAILVGRDGLMKFINPRGLELVGVEEEDLLAKPLTEFIYPEDKEMVIRNHVNWIKGRGGPDRYSFRIVQQSGNIKWVELSASLIDWDDKPAALIFLTDITDRKMAVEALMESEERYRMIFEHSPLGIVHCSVDGTVLDCNEKFAEIIGAPREAIIGMNLPTTITDKRMLQGLQDALDGKLGRYEGDYTSVTGKKTTAVRALATRLTTPDGRVLGAVGICEDRTEQKRAEHLLVQAERFKAVADLAGGVAHNFNNLLQIIVGGLDLALMDIEDGRSAGVKKSLEMLLRSSHHGAEMVRRLQSCANVRLDLQGAERTVFDLSTVVQDVREMTRPLWETTPQKEGVEIRFTVDTKEGALVRGSENEIFEVLVNLVKNAVEALPNGGELRVTTAVEKDQVIFRVSDSGIGMTEEQLKRAFDPFWSTKGLGIGTGMGLAVTRGIVKRHGGAIAAESLKGQGSTFTMTLPLATDGGEEPAVAPITVLDRQLNILVVDDEASVGAFLQDALSNFGQSCRVALSGSEAIEVFGENTFDLVICDLAMPGMNGWDVGKALRQICKERERPEVPFVLLTGWSGQTLGRGKIAESGVAEVVEKPVDIATLLESIARVTGQKP